MDVTNTGNYMNIIAKVDEHPCSNELDFVPLPELRPFKIRVEYK